MGPTGVAAGMAFGERTVRAAVVTESAWAMSIAVVVWGLIYIGLGHPLAAAHPFGFLLVSALNFLAYRQHRSFRILAWIEVVAMLLTPFLLMLSLGGLIASGAVGLWSLLAPIGALLLIGQRSAVAVFLAFVCLIAAGLWADGRLGSAQSLAPTIRDVFLLLNLLGVSLVAFWVVRTFLSANERLAAEQLRLREVERSYVAQEAMMRQNERLATLGKLSAGVAHELNNPAAAAGRATGHLGDVVNRLVDDGISLLGLGIGREGLAWLWSMVDPSPSTDPIDVADREDGVAAWLASRSAEDPWELANALATLGFDVAVLNQATERFNERQVLGALQWIADVARARRLMSEVRTSAGRISEIVGALKGYSHMDGAAVGTVDVVKGIEDTLVILKSQLTGVEVETAFHERLPPVRGNAGELNQVWTNLLANAAEALDGSGTIRVTATCDGAWVQVDVVDDGPGVPSEIVGSIFDPFVTTKAPGQGTGLGLNLTHQIVVDRHGGTIDVDSRPGHTKFVVRLPAEESNA